MYKVVTPIATEPVTLAEFKIHLKLGAETVEDSLLEGLIRSAREWCEAYTRRALATQTLELLMDHFPPHGIVLPKPPLQSVTSIKYKDYAGIETTLASSAYITDSDSDVARIVPAYGTYWPAFVAYPINPIRIRFVSGYTDLPRSIKEAIILKASLGYLNRDLAVAAETESTMDAIYSLLGAYRVFGEDL
jgi:uncharacterized phiE125 gp8 family phage protein